MYFKFTFLISLFLISTVGNSFEFIKSKNNLYVKSKNCEEVKNIVSSLSAWSKSIGEGNECKLVNKLNPDEKGFCKYNIAQCVPSHVLKYQDVRPQESGPNCFNLALVMKGILPYLRYTSDDEMKFLTMPPLCNEIPTGQKPLPGDLAAIRIISPDGDSREEHSYIYISDDLYYSKNGSDKEAPYRLQSSKEMDKVFNLGRLASLPSCRAESKNTVENKYSYQSCKIIKYFKCISMNEYLASRNDLPISLIKTNFKEIERAEGCLQYKMFTKKPNDKVVENHILNAVKILTKLAEQEDNEISSLKNSDKLFILGNIKLRLNAINSQLEEMKADYQPEFASLMEIFNKKIATHVSTRCRRCAFWFPGPNGSGHGSHGADDYESCAKLSAKEGYVCNTPELFIP